jgi:hypothetical protein
MFDLAVCLEVAEHLAPQSARSLIISLTQLAPAALFSAAIPSQGGEHHVNEQWPQYWTDIFAQHDFVCYDALRPRLWSNPAVAWWYAQNMLLFVKRDQQYPVLSKITTATAFPQALVHPDAYLKLAWKNLVLQVAAELLSHVPAGQGIVLVDDDQFGTMDLPARDIVPFTDCDGVYNGPPPDDCAACEEFERHRKSGARFICVGSPAFWWLDRYTEFARRLRESCNLILENERLFLFDMCSRS